ncbi:MAG: hypothetical protein ACREDK_04415 [Thermoplasmata archaeon]
MFCTYCAKEIAPGATTCAACGKPFVPPPPSAPPSATPPLDQMAKDMETAAREFAGATARLSKRVLERASIAADDPKGAAKRAAQRVKEELDRAKDDLERILRKN